jgi:hypothetical protein
MREKLKQIPWWGWLILILAIGLAAGYWFGYDIGYEKAQRNTINSFEECAAAGYPVQESYPGVCRTPDGRSFTQQASEPAKKTVGKQEALRIINQCGAVGTYSLHSGELGLVLKNDAFQPVSGTTEEYLKQNQNPDCPFTKTIIE